MLDRRGLKTALTAPVAARTVATWATLIATVGCTLLARTLIAVLAVMSQLTLRGAVVCWVLANALSSGLAIGFVARVGGRLARVDWRLLAGSFKFGAQAWLSQLTGIVNFRIALVLTQLLL